MNNAIIEKIEATIVDLPTIRPHHLSMTVMRNQTLVIVRIFCSDDIVGIGEATTIGGLSYGQESPEGIKLTIDTYLAPALIGKQASAVNMAMHVLDKVGIGNHFAKSAIETALFDALGKRLNVSVATLLGGVVQEKLGVLWTLASGDTAKDIEEAHQILDTKRHDTFKLKIGRKNPNVDIAHVTAIKQAVGNDVKITVDINQAWDEQTAKRAIAALQDAGVDLVEQPIPRENVEGMARLTQMFIIPIMADESVNGPHDAFKSAKLFAGSVFALKIAKAGGLANVLKTAAIADAAGIALYGGTMLEGTIGTAASAHAFSTLPWLSWGTELFGPLLLTDDIVKKGIEYRNGTMILPEGPGLGIELDMDKFSHYTRKTTDNLIYNS
jgi:muconate cycloisomerase